MRAYRLKGGQRGYRGCVVDVAGDVEDLLTRLPRASTDVSVFVVRRKGHGNGTHKDFFAKGDTGYYVDALLCGSAAMGKLVLQ